MEYLYLYYYIWKDIRPTTEELKKSTIKGFPPAPAALYILN